MANTTIRTVIDDISAFGPELDEEQLLVVTGGDGPDGGSGSGVCGPCHDYAS